MFLTLQIPPPPPPSQTHAQDSPATSAATSAVFSDGGAQCHKGLQRGFPLHHSKQGRGSAQGHGAKSCSKVKSRLEPLLKSTTPILPSPAASFARQISFLQLLKRKQKNVPESSCPASQYQLLLALKLHPFQLIELAPCECISVTGPCCQL